MEFLGTWNSSSNFIPNCGSGGISIFNLKRVVMGVSDISVETLSTKFSNIRVLQLPKVMYVGFVAAEDFHGTPDRNPLLFTFGLFVSKCGSRRFPSSIGSNWLGLQLDFAGGRS